MRHTILPTHKGIKEIGSPSAEEKANTLPYQRPNSISLPSLTICVTLGKSFKDSAPQFSHLYNGSNSNYLAC